MQIVYKMGKTIHLLSVIVCCMLAVACHEDAVQVDQSADTDNTPTLLTQVQKCSRLYTTEYHIHKIVTHDDVVRLKGNLLKKDFDFALPLGERKIAIPMDATVKAYIDMSEITEENIERDGDKVTIVLPDPKLTLTSSKIRQQDIREYVGVMRSHFTDREMASYEQQGRQAIIDHLSHLNFLTTAQENATRVLVPILVQMGYKEENITIAFRKGLNLRQLIPTKIERYEETR